MNSLWQVLQTPPYLALRILWFYCPSKHLLQIKGKILSSPCTILGSFLTPYPALSAINNKLSINYLIILARTLESSDSTIYPSSSITLLYSILVITGYSLSSLVVSLKILENSFISLFILSILFLLSTNILSSLKNPLRIIFSNIC